MGVVTKYGSAANHPDTKPPALITTGLKGGRIRTLFSHVALANGDSATSKIYFGKIPSNAVIQPNALILTDAITGLTDFDLGGEGDAKDALVNGQTLASASRTISAVSAVAIENLGMRLWQLFGYDKDPGKDLDIIGTLNEATSAAGDVCVYLPYVVD